MNNSTTALAAAPQQNPSDRHEGAADAIAQARKLVLDFDIQLSDIFPATKKGKKAAKKQRIAPTSQSGQKVAIKYRNPVTGQTWTGRGKTPTWLIGHQRDTFLISPEQALNLQAQEQAKTVAEAVIDNAAASSAAALESDQAQAAQAAVDLPAETSETDAQAQAEQEAQAQAQVDADAAEAKAEAEAEAEAQAQAQAQAKAEAQAQAEAEALAQAQAEAEALAQAQAKNAQWPFNQGNAKEDEDSYVEDRVVDREETQGYYPD